MAKRIKTIHTLNRSIRELKEKKKDLELRMEDNFDNLKENYWGMTINSIFGGRRSSTHFWADIVGRIMESEKLQKGVADMVGKAADKLGDLFKKD